MQQVNLLKYAFLVIIIISLTAAECVESLDESEVKWRIEQWYEEEYDTLVYDAVFGDEEIGSSGFAAVRPNNPEQEVTYELYIDEEFRGSCKIVYEGECEIIPVLEKGEAERLYSLSIGRIYGGESRVEIEITSKKPGYDLTSGYMSPLMGTVTCGIPATYQGSIYNLGDTAITEPFKIKAHVSGESYETTVNGIDACGHGEIYLYNVIFDSEDGCEQYRGEEDYDLYPISIIVDSEDDISEYDESNNVFEDEFYVIFLSEGVNLESSEVAILEEVVSGDPFEVSYSVSNSGTTDIDVPFYVDLDYSCFKTSGNLERVQVQGLKAGSTKTLHTTATLNGKYCQIILTVDSDNDVDEWWGYYILHPNGEKTIESKDPMEFDNTYYSRNILYMEYGHTVAILNNPHGAEYHEKPVFEENETIEELNETEEVSPLCEGVSCEDYCKGDTLYSGTCNPETGECEYSSEECENGCDPEFARCIEMIGSLHFDVFIDEGYVPGVVASGEDSITVTASLNEYGLNSVESIEGVDVRFELTGPGNQVVEGKTDSNGKIEATFVIPHWDEFFPPQEGFYYGFTKTNIELEVSASKHDSGYDFDYSDGPYTIEVISPAIAIEGISIDPNPAQAYGEHTIRIRTSDEYVEGPAHFIVTVSEGVLSYEGLEGEYGGGIGFDSYGNTVVYWEAPQRGLTPYEISIAKEVLELGGEYGVQTSANIIKAAGYIVPVIDTGKDVYGMYGDAKDIWEDAGEYSGSLSTEEKVYRGADLALSEVKFIVGGVNLVTGNVPVLGKLSDWTVDGIDTAIGTGEIYLKQKAADLRNEQMETRSMDMFVEVEVRDSEGYYDRDYLIFEMEYLWKKEG